MSLPGASLDPLDGGGPSYLRLPAECSSLARARSESARLVNERSGLAAKIADLERWLRQERAANSFLGMVHLATARYWLKFVHAA